MSSISANSPAVVEDILRGGQAWSRILRRGQTLELTDIEGGAAVAGLFYNARNTLERYSMPDTLKAQHVARITEGVVLYSDMGRVLCSVVHDTYGWHATITGHMTAHHARAKYGEGSYQTLRNGFYRNTRDNFLTELGKHGLGKRDITANVNFFVKVLVAEGGQLEFVPEIVQAGSRVVLRAELDTLIVLSNTPHPLDPRPTYAPTVVGLRVAWGAPAGLDDPCRRSRPENERGFRLTEAYLDEGGTAP